MNRPSRVTDVIGVRRMSKAQTALLWAAVLTFVLYLVPFGNYVLYPLMLFSTFVHEAGHGLTAVLMGGYFDSMAIWSDGSGVARYAAEPSRLTRALVAAGGLLGPAVAGAIFFACARRGRWSRAALMVLGIGSIVAIVLVVRNLFGVVFVGAVAAMSLWIAVKANLDVAQGVTAFFAIQLSLSVFSRGDYLFVQYARTSGGLLPSDTQQIADALFLPYWFWGAIVGALSLAIVAWGIWTFLKVVKPD